MNLCAWETNEDKIFISEAERSSPEITGSKTEEEPCPLFAEVEHEELEVAAVGNVVVVGGVGLLGSNEVVETGSWRSRAYNLSTRCFSRQTFKASSNTYSDEYR